VSPLIPLQGPFWHTVKRASMPDEHCETSAMPPREGLRLNHLNRTQKAGPKPGDPYEQRAITAKPSETRWSPPQSDAPLMAEKQILGLKLAPAT
jgi:hypothetical protein